MKRFQRILSLLMIACLLPIVGLAAEALGFRLLDVPETTDISTVTIPFEGEAGVRYTLHYRYRNIWLLPETKALGNESQGEFTVELGIGQNDFVLTEENQPRDGEQKIAFSITYTPPETEETQQAAGVEGATPETSPEATDATAEPTEAPAAEPTPEPTPEPIPEPTPEPTMAPEPEPEPEPEGDPADGTDRTLGLWMKGNDVTALQEGLEALGINFGKVDGVYGPRTRAAIMRFQRRYSLGKVDGLVGVETRAMLSALGVEIPPYEAPDMTRPAGFERDLSIGKEGMDVYALQEALQRLGYLDRDPDQVFGRRTRTAVRAFQRDNGLKVDGVAGPDTLRLLIDGDVPTKQEAAAAAAPEEVEEAPAEAAEALAPEATPIEAPDAVEETKESDTNSG